MIVGFAALFGWSTCGGGVGGSAVVFSGISVMFFLLKICGKSARY